MTKKEPLSHEKIEEMLALIDAGQETTEVARAYNITESGLRYHINKRAGLIKSQTTESHAPLSMSAQHITSEKRSLIREYLDKNFDDMTGRYNMNCSDRECSELVGVPMIIVRLIREAAYGIMREDDEAFFTNLYRELHVEAQSLSNRLMKANTQLADYLLAKKAKPSC